MNFFGRVFDSRRLHHINKKAIRMGGFFIDGFEHCGKRTQLIKDDS